MMHHRLNLCLTKRDFSDGRKHLFSKTISTLLWMRFSPFNQVARIAPSAFQCIVCTNLIVVFSSIVGARMITWLQRPRSSTGFRKTKSDCASEKFRPLDFATDVWLQAMQKLRFLVKLS